MRDILFKIIDGKVNVIVNENFSFNQFIEVLRKRLQGLYIKDDLLKANIVLDIKNISLTPKEILTIFDVLAGYENIFISKILFNSNKNKNIILHEGNIRSGEIKLFSNNTLLIGNINKGAKVIVDGNLYIIGKVSGLIEFKGITNKLYASSIDSSFIKICGVSKQIEGTLENSLVSLVNDSILEESFIDRRENIYGKSNSSYIW